MSAQEHAIAYLTLYSQEYKKNPKLSVAQFNHWLYETHKANIKAAKAQFDAAKGKK